MTAHPNGQAAAGITLADLAPIPIWVAWQTENRKDAKGNDKPTKVPYSSNGRKAEADDPQTWCIRQHAEAKVETLPKPFNEGGIGLELCDLGSGVSLAGVDLDTCREPDGMIASWAQSVIDRFATYAEVSPSQTGVKVFCTYQTSDLDQIRAIMGTAEWGKQWKRGSGEHPPAIELYVGRRYFALTGQHVQGTPATIQPVSLDTLTWLIQTAGPAFAPKPKGATGGGTDGSRSARALRVGLTSRRTGATYAEMCEAIAADPDTNEWHDEKGIAAGGRELQRIWDKAGDRIAREETANSPVVTEDGLGIAFTEEHRDRLRFDHTQGKWHRWTGQAWKVDETKLAFSWARVLCRKIAREANAEGRELIALSKVATAAAVEKFAQADQALAVTTAIWDRDPWLLGTPGGTVDLKTGEIREAAPEEYISRLTAVAPAATADCPLWRSFLDEVTANDPDMVRFLQQWCGYCLTGDTREHALVFACGPGGNGKGVFLGAVARVMGDYARNAAMDSFTSTSGDKHPTDLAMLAGARLVTASETEEGRPWAESRIKALTGGDMITARFMRRDFFEYRPLFKLFIIGNHKPILRNVDDAARRRFNIAPFDFKPPKPDKALEIKLQAEWPSILRWMIDGCLDWQRNGLMRPPVVVNATEEYFQAQDYFARWIEECCDLSSSVQSKASHLLHSFKVWCEQNGEQISDNRRLRGMIERIKGTRYTKSHGIQIVRGISLKPDKPSYGNREE